MSSELELSEPDSSEPENECFRTCLQNLNLQSLNQILQNLNLQNFDSSEPLNLSELLIPVELLRTSQNF
ncbi:hypothetical protein L195_g024802 [Trifolium pratense]|uniref:Uncharacterized protein n=1 Tax=Trifolium pratense TaxID=57577 RepID=A0A2K3NEP5_TRIPR|nr:hypothetical protein L195_g024802 [Trifolium pratense]